MTDYIDRQVAIDAIERLILPQTKGETMAEEINRVAWRCAINCAEEIIGQLPSAEVEPVKRGKWTRKESKRMYWYVCSECGGGCPCNGYGQDMFTEWCPNCGARMSEGSEE